MTEHCPHTTNCTECNKLLCAYCVEMCSGCAIEACEECYGKHLIKCKDCINLLCPNEIQGEYCPACKYAKENING